MTKEMLLLAHLVFLLVFVGCHPKRKVEYDRPLPEGELGLRKITAADEIPDFTEGSFNLVGLSEGIEGSLNYLSKPSSSRFFPYGDISHERMIASLRAFDRLIDEGLRGSRLNDAILEQFDIYTSVGCDYAGTVLYTGYFTPVFDGSLRKTSRFRYPLYSKPNDLVKDDYGVILGRKEVDGKLKAYPARAEIEQSGMLEGNELVWLDGAFKVYIAHVQGSAVIKLDDGKKITVGYAANNGHKYKSISTKLVEDGVLSREQLSLSAMIDYFEQHPEQVEEYTSVNPRFVFFQKSRQMVRGSLNEPVISMRTIATDKSVYPRGGLAFIAVNLPQMVSGRIFHSAYRGFVLDQDTGGAIRAPGRCDVYMGQGEMAGEISGRVYQEGRLYYLFIKPEYMDAGGEGDFASDGSAGHSGSAAAAEKPM